MLPLTFPVPPKGIYCQFMREFFWLGLEVGAWAIWVWIIYGWWKFHWLYSFIGSFFFKKRKKKRKMKHGLGYLISMGRLWYFLLFMTTTDCGMFDWLPFLGSCIGHFSFHIVDLSCSPYMLLYLFLFLFLLSI